MSLRQTTFKASLRSRVLALAACGKESGHSRQRDEQEPKLKRVKVQDMLKARDRMERVMISVKKDKKDGKTGQGVSVKNRLKRLNFSL